MNRSSHLGEELVPARQTDPDTSHLAISSAALATIRVQVFNLFAEFGPMTDHELIARYQERHGYHVEDSSIRTRRSELVRDNKLVDIGIRVIIPGHKKSIAWARVQ